MSAARAFAFEENAKRSSQPLRIGLAGPSGGGKTLSALRLARGVQEVAGGDIYVIDTETGRAKHYSDDFRFTHVAFEAPYGSLDYAAAIDGCVARGARIIIVDSMSHEHEGVGGYLEFHDREVERLVGAWRSNAMKVQIPAWAEPAKLRRRLIDTIVHTEASFIFCFRAKEKLKIKTGKDPIELGWMPIAGVEFVYELQACALLPPNARGVPEWKPEMPGERQMVKLPYYFEPIFAERRALDEAHGRALAEWARGGAAKATETTRVAGPAETSVNTAPGGEPAARPATSDADAAPCWEPIGGKRCKRERGHTGPHIRES